MRPVPVCVLVVSSIAGTARGVVVYDAITTNNWHASFFVEDEFADDTTLSTGAGTTIRQVEVGALRNGGFPGTYSGTMTVRLWADAGGVPGAFLGAGTTRWCSRMMCRTSSRCSCRAWSRRPGRSGRACSSPSQRSWARGSCSGRRPPAWAQRRTSRRATTPDNSWGVGAGPNFTNWIRIDTVPGPGAAVALALGGVLLARRRGR